MKKYLFALLVATIPLTVTAQETIPLFEDIPSFTKSEPAPETVVQQVTPSEPTGMSNNTVSATTSNESKPVQTTRRRPRLGRDAEPLTSIVIAPFPNTTIEFDSENRKKEDKKKQFTEEGITESDLIKREKPLNVTESAHPLTKKILEEQIRAGALNRHDVSQFKLVGIGLKWDPESVFDQLSEIGYTLDKVEKSIPLFKTTMYDEECRQINKLTILSEIRECVLERAEKDEAHYVFRETYNRPQSRETVQVYYSSPDTNNLSYKIIYKNKGDNSLNSSRKNMAKKIKRQQDFWNMVFELYGLPDENKTLLWGDGDTVYMQAMMRGSAYDAYIVMEDRLIQDKDYEAAQNEFKTLRVPTAFTFNGEVPEKDDEIE